MTTVQTRHRLSKHDLKTDAFTTNIFRAKEWAEENSRIVLLAIAAVVVLAAAVWGVTSYVSGQAHAAQQLYGEAGVEIRSGNNSVAIALLQKLVDEHGGSDVAGAGCFLLGQLHFQERTFDDARVIWQKYINDYGDDPLMVASAWAGLGAIEEQAGFPENALDQYQNAIEADPEGFQASYNVRRLIRAAVAAGDTARAMSAYERLKEDYPVGNEDLTIAEQMLIEKGLLDPNSL